MVASIKTPADVVNMGLVKIGHPFRIGSLYDGSMAAKKALDIYAQMRDEMLRDVAPDFSQRTIALTLLKSAPPGGYIPPTIWDPTTNPPLPWLYEYTYPADCLKVGSLRTTPIFVPEFDPSPRLFEVSNDNAYTPQRRVILAYTPNAICDYVGQVTDPTVWDVNFVTALSDQIAERLTVALGDPKLLQAEAQEAGLSTAIAGSVRG